jgi:hypothetical protein
LLAQAESASAATPARSSARRRLGLSETARSKSSTHIRIAARNDAAATQKQ